MNEPIQKVAEATGGTAWEGKLWLVGGAVRDSLLGLGESSDLDILVEGDALALGSALFEAGVSEIAPTEYPRFGTVLLHVLGEKVELATSRKESYSTNSRKPTVEPASLEEDALRRDFTINTLLQNLHTGEIRDPLGSGRADLAAKILRTPREPKGTFSDDPLRMLRAVRFRWRLGFEPAPGLYEAIAEEAERLSIISKERIRDELTLMLTGPAPAAALRDLMDLGLLQQFAPDLAALQGLEQGKWHTDDAWDHTLKVMSGAPSTLTLRLAALMHDIAKPNTKSIEHSGNIHFFQHEKIGAAMALEWLRTMKFSTDLAETVSLLVRHHMRLSGQTRPTQQAIRRLVRDLDGHHEELFDLIQADANALRVGTRTIDLEDIRTRVKELGQEAAKPESPLTGEEIMQITGLAAGKEIGSIKNMLTERVLDGSLDPNDKETARKVVTDWMH